MNSPDVIPEAAQRLSGILLSARVYGAMDPALATFGRDDSGGTTMG